MGVVEDEVEQVEEDSFSQLHHQQCRLNCTGINQSDYSNLLFNLNRHKEFKVIKKCISARTGREICWLSSGSSYVMKRSIL